MFGPSFGQFNLGSRRGLMAPSPIILSGSGLREASVTFSHAELVAGSDKTIVPAVAGYVINPVAWWSYKSIPVTPYAPTNVSFNIAYAGSPTVSRLTALTPVVTSAGTRIDRTATTAGAALDPAITLAVGVALVVHPGSGNGGGAAANKLKFVVVYELITPP